MCPDADEHAPEESPACFVEPDGARDTRAMQHRVEQPFALQYPFPDERDHDRREQHGVEENPAEETAAEDLAVEHERRDEAEEHHQADLKQGEPRRVECGAPEQIDAATRRIEIAAAIEARLPVFRSGEWASRTIAI